MVVKATSDVHRPDTDGGHGGEPEPFQRNPAGSGPAPDRTPFPKKQLIPKASPQFLARLSPRPDDAFRSLVSLLLSSAVPTSLSNDGFCSPQSSLLFQGKRRSLPAAIRYGLVIDTAVCREAPIALTLSGIRDLVAKFTAVRDWNLAFHACDEPVDDFAALLSDGSVHAYMSHPIFDANGMRLLATALMMNGIAMVMICFLNPIGCKRCESR